MESNYKYLNLYTLPTVNGDIVKNSKFDVAVAGFPPQPQFSLGFHYYIHQSYELFQNAIKSQGNKNFYWVINGFEMYLTDQEKKNELIDKVVLYSELKKSDIDDPIFLQIWEILMLSDLFKKTNKIHINSNKSNFVESAISVFTKKVVKSTFEIAKKDYDISIITLNNNNRSLLDNESFSFKNILLNINDSLSNLKNTGSLIVELDDLFTLPTNKLLFLLRTLFDNAYIYKPYYSRPTESQKYLICTNFDKKMYDSISKKLQKSIALIEKNQNFIIDFLSDIEIPRNFKTVVNFINVKIAGEQHKYKNKIMNYINSEDYFGQEYQDASTRQLDSTEYFLSHFCPINTNDYSDIRKEFMVEINKRIEETKQFHNLVV